MVVINTVRNIMLIKKIKMAFQTPNAGQERANRRILEQLEEQKKKLRNSQMPNTQTTTNTTTSITNSDTVPSKTAKTLNTELGLMTPAQRAAIQHAHANSVGYFITQDSSFGNLILPVLPRFESNVSK